MLRNQEDRRSGLEDEEYNGLEAIISPEMKLLLCRREGGQGRWLTKLVWLDPAGTWLCGLFRREFPRETDAS